MSFVQNQSHSCAVIQETIKKADAEQSTKAMLSTMALLLWFAVWNTFKQAQNIYLAAL